MNASPGRERVQRAWRRFDDAVKDCAKASPPGWTATDEGKARFDAAFERYLSASAEVTAAYRERDGEGSYR
jgi:hypothetical protein